VRQHAPKERCSQDDPLGKPGACGGLVAGDAPAQVAEISASQPVSSVGESARSTRRRRGSPSRSSRSASVLRSGSLSARSRLPELLEPLLGAHGELLIIGRRIVGCACRYLAGRGGVCILIAVRDVLLLESGTKGRKEHESSIWSRANDAVARNYGEREKIVRKSSRDRAHGRGRPWLKSTGLSVP
jgi:hypothetical protein